MRKRHQAFGRGDLQILSSDNPKTLAFVRRWGDEKILVVANLSRFAQCAWIDMAEFKGLAPVEMLGRTQFPTIGDGAYRLTLGPYAFYWFTLTPEGRPSSSLAAEPPTLTVSGSAGWEGVFRGKAKLALEEALPAYLQTRRWYQGRFRTLKAVTIRDAVTVPPKKTPSRIALVQVEYVESDPELYLLPLAFAPDSAPNTEAGATAPVVARLRVRPRGEGEAVQGVLYEPCGDRTFIAPLLDAATRAAGWRATPATCAANRVRIRPTLPEGRGGRRAALVEASNTSAILEGRGVLLKLYRRIEEGPHPEVEILRYFARTRLVPAHAPTLGRAGIQARSRRGDDGRPSPRVRRRRGRRLAPDARFAAPLLRSRPDRGVRRRRSGNGAALGRGPQRAGRAAASAWRLLGAYLETARLMARRTAEMHVALAAGVDDPAFAPEPFTAMYQRSLYQSMRGQIRKTLERLRPTAGSIAGSAARTGPSESSTAKRTLLRLARASWTRSRRCASAVTAIIISSI